MWCLTITIFQFYILINSVALGEKDWPGPYFPHKPGDPDVISDSQVVNTPSPPQSYRTKLGKWTGPWFPNPPGRENYHPSNTQQSINSDNNDSNNIVKPVTKQMGLVNPACDNAQDNLQLDYDPKNVTQQLRHICLDNRDNFKPNITLDGIIQDYTIPPQYSALHRCMNESITYDYRIPTFGTHRSVWPVYGEYNYVPVQRWLHNLEHGAIVALYHPCADKNQISTLKTLIKKCLFRHIITPYEKLDADRPFALVAWGKSLELPYIDTTVIVGFIRMNALQAPEKTSRDGQYDVDLIEKATLLSPEDQALCPNM